MKDLLTCGEFAKLCHITKRVLFYYDELGLLKPAYVNEKNYRYYSIHQYDQISTIKLFQNLGMSLKDIQGLIHKEDLQEKKQILNEQLQIVDQKIKDFENIRNNLLFLSKRFSLLQKNGFNHLFIESIDEEYYYCEAKPTDGEVWMSYMNYGYQYGVIFDENDFNHFQWTFQRCEKDKANYIKPQGQYYAMFFLLKDEEILNCVPQFLKKIDVSNTCGPMYHEDYCSEIAGYGNQYVIKLSIQKK
ncbi:MAG: MerR family transcriptional regulator [Longibaculum sp.]